MALTTADADGSTALHAEDEEWQQTEAQLNDLLDERQRLASILELEQMKKCLLSTHDDTPGVPKTAWSEDVKPGPALTSCASLAVLSDADERMQRLMASPARAGLDAEYGEDSGPLSDADRTRLARLLDDAEEGADEDVDPDELARMMQGMELQLQELQLQNAKLELEQMKAALESEKRALAEQKENVRT